MQGALQAGIGAGGCQLLRIGIAHRLRRIDAAAQLFQRQQFVEPLVTGDLL